MAPQKVYIIHDEDGDGIHNIYGVYSTLEAAENKELSLLEERYLGEKEWLIERLGSPYFIMSMELDK